MKWLNKFKFWGSKPKTVAPHIVNMAILVDYEKLILEEWNSIKFPDSYYKNETADVIVRDFKLLLVQKYGMKYLASGGSSNVYVDKDEKFVVKICQVMGEETPFNNYKNYQQTQDVMPNWSNQQDAYNYQQIKRIFREHVLFPTHISNNNYLCIQRYLKKYDNDNELIMNYFNNLLGSYQIQAWRRRIGWRDMAPINNIGWCRKENRAYVIDI